MKLVELSTTNTILQMEHITSAPNERVLCTTQLAKLSFNHPSVVLTADVFRYFYKIKSTVTTAVNLELSLKRKSCASRGI